jgi:hypothetical protein
MKYKFAIGLILGLMLAVCLGATVDLRNRGNGEKEPIVEHITNTVTWASGETGQLSFTTIQNTNGLLGRIDVNSTNATNAVTYSLDMIDENGATVVPAIASIPENAVTTYNGYDSDTTFSAVMITGAVTPRLTISGDPGASGASVYLVLRWK